MHTLKNILEQSLRRDPKKAAILAALALVLAVLVVRQLAGMPNSAAGDAGIIGLVTGVGTSPEARMSVPNLTRGARLAQQWRQSPVPPTIRNLFLSELNTPPVRPPDLAQPATPTFREDDGLFWRQLERALAERSDREGFKSRLAARALADAGTLSVTSVVAGPESRALVGDKLVRVGDLISAGNGEGGPFTVVAIEPQRVILARDSHRIAITLGRPGAQIATDTE